MAKEIYDIQIDRRTREGRALYEYLKALPFVEVIEDKPARPKSKKST